MKRFLTFLMVLISMFLFGCSKVSPLENPEPELFSSFHEEDEFTILKRTEINPDQIYISIGYIINSPKGYSCLVGQYEKVNYIVLYDDDYYDIIGASQLKLFTADELSDWGINVSCRIESRS